VIFVGRPFSGRLPPGAASGLSGSIARLRYRNEPNGANFLHGISLCVSACSQ
jgi:hypothetical protein